MDVLSALGVFAVFVLAGAVKGITGMGLPTVAVSLLGLWMAPAQAAAVLIAPSLLTNVAQCRGPHARTLVARLWPAWVMLALVTVVLPDVDGLLHGLDSRKLLGAVLVAYGLLGLWRPSMPDLSGLPPAALALAAAFTGALTGCVTAATAVFAMPLVPFLQTLRLDKDAMIQALGLSFTVATLALAVRVQAVGSGGSLVSWGAAVALVAALVGLRLGGIVRARLSGQAFQRGLALAFVGLGAANLLR